MDKSSLGQCKEYYIDTPKGKVAVFGPVNQDTIAYLSMDRSLNCFRPWEKQKMALMDIASIEKGYVFIACLDWYIIGYVTFHPPEPFERWGKGNIGSILELGAIEVARGFRGYGIAHRLLEAAFDQGRMEEYIVIATEYYWHWDLIGEGLHIWDYRIKLEKLMATVGLYPRETSDPEINSHPANALMVRIGSKVSPSDIEAFDKLAQI